MKPRAWVWRNWLGSAGILALMALASFSVSSPVRAQEWTADVSIAVFNDALSPYGEWLYVGSYGRVWRPRVSLVGLGFRPYVTGGHWVYTSYGWSFVSDYEWGWAPFHYGRWVPDPDYGWIWVPDTVWAPAWVEWRYGSGFVGWAPLAPPGARIVISSYYPAWCFVPTQHFIEWDFHRHALPVEHFHRVFSVTAPVDHQISYGGIHWSAGPPAGQISHEVGRPLQAVAVAPPRPGVVERVHIGAAGAPSGLPAGPSLHSAPAPSAAPGGIAPQGGQPWGRPASGAPQPPHTLGAPVPVPQVPGQSGVPSGERLHNGWAAPSSRPVAPAPALSPPSSGSPAGTPHINQPPAAPQFHPAPGQQVAPIPQGHPVSPAPSQQVAPVPQGHPVSPAPSQQVAPVPQGHPVSPAPSQQVAPVPQGHPVGPPPSSSWGHGWSGSSTVRAAPPAPIGPPAGQFHQAPPAQLGGQLHSAPVESMGRAVAAAPAGGVPSPAPVRGPTAGAPAGQAHPGHFH